MGRDILWPNPTGVAFIWVVGMSRNGQRLPDGPDGPEGASGKGGCLGPALVLMALAVAFVLAQGLSGPRRGGGSTQGPTAQGLVSGAAPVPADEPGATHRVETATLRGRAGPSARSAVVRTLSRGARVRVVRRTGRWLKVAQGGQTFWVARRYVAPVTAHPAGGGVAGHRSSARFRAPAHRGRYRAAALSGATSRARRSSSRRGRHRKRRRIGGYEGGGCPCRGSTVCIGPRGGRYCITSGGNKRYGV